MSRHATRVVSSLLAGAAVMFAGAACDSESRERGGPAPSPTAAGEPTGPHHTDAPRTTDPPRFPELDLPADARVLVPVMEGTEAADTPRFTVPDMKYRVYWMCTGGGTVKLDGEGRKAVPCDGVIHRMTVLTDAETAVVRVRPRGPSVRWSLAVIETDNPSFITPG